MLSELIRGGPGHPLHPPLTDLTIGMYSLAAALGVIGAAGGIREAAAKAMWLALVSGIISTQRGPGAVHRPVPGLSVFAIGG